MKHYRTTIMAALLSATAVSAAYAADPIKIGVVTPLTGTYAGIGQQVKWGLELATKEVNAKGGIMGRQIELIYEDSEANPSVAVQKAEKLYEVSNVDFLTGTVNSGATLAVGQVAERAKKLIATTVSFADFDHRRQVLAQRVPRQCQGRSAVDRAGSLARQSEAKGEGVLSRPRLPNGPLDRCSVQGGGGESRRH